MFGQFQSNGFILYAFSWPGWVTKPTIHLTNNQPAIIPDNIYVFIYWFSKYNRKISLKFPSLSLFSSRPGRPPKRSLGMSLQDGSRLLPHSVHGLLSPSLLSPTGTTCSLHLLISLTCLTFLLSWHLSSSALNLLFFSSLSVLALVLFFSGFLAWSDSTFFFFPSHNPHYARSLSFCLVLFPPIFTMLLSWYCLSFSMPLISLHSALPILLVKQTGTGTHLNLQLYEISEAYEEVKIAKPTIYIYRLHPVWYFPFCPFFLTEELARGVGCACFFFSLLSTLAFSPPPFSRQHAQNQLILIFFFHPVLQLATTASQTEVKVLNFCGVLFLPLMYTFALFSPCPLLIFSFLSSLLFSFRTIVSVYTCMLAQLV